KYFIDSTGDGTLGAYAGAEYMRGSESRDVFNEALAPEQGDDYTMGNTILFKARDTGGKCEFIKPFWAYDITEEMLANRNHTNLSYGYWWIELGGMGTDTIKDYETIKDELMKWAFGIWDHIKNKGDHGADNYELVWVGALPGKRESRRLTGDYVLKADDLLEGRVFDDAVAYGGWPMDMHVPGGLEATVAEPTEYFHLVDMYTIPYRSLYSKNIANLFIAGRAISCSKLAFGSIRVMATTGVIGQAAGTAAALASEKGVDPRGVNEFIDELQRKLMNDDAYLHGYRFRDKDDIVIDAKITCSSQRHPCENIRNGYTRNIGNEINYWESGPLMEGQFIKVDFDNAASVREVQLRFDSNLTREIRPSMSLWATNSQVRGVPPELVKDYKVELFLNGKPVGFKEVTGNYMRLNKLSFDSVIADSAKITVTATNGWSTVRIFDFKILKG
ncbi:MAG: FAD-dependent oxidoreductase, partial [Clostridia bacterium]|nr:FAD-dependent oxidoreductase [Clostridia bacterium]